MRVWVFIRLMRVSMLIFRNTISTYFLLLGFAKFANKNEIIIIGFFTIHVNADAMIPAFTGFTEHPNNSAIRSKAALFT